VWLRLASGHPVCEHGTVDEWSDLQRVDAADDACTDEPPRAHDDRDQPARHDDPASDHA
jgi:hypothetical protein